MGTAGLLAFNTVNDNGENKTNQFLGASMDSDGKRFVVSQVANIVAAWMTV